MSNTNVLFYSIIAVIVLLLMLVNCIFGRAREHRGMRFLVLLLTSFFILILFSVRPMKLIDELAKYGKQDSPAIIALPTGATSEQDKADALELIKEEHKKAIAEINLRIGQEDSWFHYKFLLVGGLFSLLLGKLVLGDKVMPSVQAEKLLDPKMMSIVLALATIVALAIDIHIRNNIMVVQQLGLWIANYVEPTLLHKAFDPQKSEGFLPWEQFLRNKAAGEAMHSDDLYGFIFYPHLHFLTWVIYISYIGFFQTFAISNKRRSNSPLVDTEATAVTSPVDSPSARNHAEAAGERPMEWFVIAGFALVHVSLLAFTCIAHFTPRTFRFKIFPWDENLSEGGWKGVAYFLPPLISLLLLNLPYLFLLFPRKPRVENRLTRRYKAIIAWAKLRKPKS